MTASRAARILISDKRPATERIMFLSAVNILFTNWPMLHLLPACPNPLTKQPRSTSLFPVFAAAFVVLSMLQNQLHRPNKLTGEFLFLLTKQRDLQLYLSYTVNMPYFKEKNKEEFEARFVWLVVKKPPRLCERNRGE